VGNIGLQVLKAGVNDSNTIHLPSNLDKINSAIKKEESKFEKSDKVKYILYKLYDDIKKLET
jgi:hypothetical protein